MKIRYKIIKGNAEGVLEMDVKSLLERTKEIKMPKEMEKRIVENVLKLSNSFSDQVIISHREHRS